MQGMNIISSLEQRPKSLLASTGQRHCGLTSGCFYCTRNIKLYSGPTSLTLLKSYENCNLKKKIFPFQLSQISLQESQSSQTCVGDVAAEEQLSHLHSQLHSQPSLELYREILQSSPDAAECRRFARDQDLLKFNLLVFHLLRCYLQVSVTVVKSSRISQTSTSIFTLSARF